MNVTQPNIYVHLVLTGILHDIVSMVGASFYQVSFTDAYSVASKAVLLQCICTLFALHFIFNWRKPTIFLTHIYQKYCKYIPQLKNSDTDTTKRLSTKSFILFQSSKNIPKIKPQFAEKLKTVNSLIASFRPLKLKIVNPLIVWLYFFNPLKQKIVQPLIELLYFKSSLFYLNFTRVLQEIKFVKKEAFCRLSNELYPCLYVFRSSIFYFFYI